MIHGGFPFAPLAGVLERCLPETTTERGPGGSQVVPAGDFTRAADVLGVCRQSLTRWSRGQLLTLAQADRCAIRLGLHPTLIWDDFNRDLRPARRRSRRTGRTATRAPQQRAAGYRAKAAA